MWWAIGLALTACAGAGLFIGAWTAAQSPSFYAGVARLVVDAVLPDIMAQVARDFGPENAARVSRAARQGLEPGRTPERHRDH